MAFEEKMSELKKPRDMGEFGTKEARDLEHAMDIITTLKSEVSNSQTLWDKLGHARNHLDKLIKAHLESNKETSE